MLKVVKVVLRFTQIIITFILAFLLLCNMYIIISKKITGNIHPDIFGFSIAVVASGSMEPEISVDDIIIINEKDTYNKGDIITFQRENSIITHRIDKKIQSGFITKGDANNVSDKDIVNIEDIFGKVVLIIPSVGKFINYIKTPLGMTAIIFIGIIVLELPILLNKKYE